jgi:ABC-type transport system involved in multi-copper enzyme maturation permease subunit
MITNDSFQMRKNTGLSGGFSNLFYMEMSRWWKSKHWIFQIILWSGYINLSMISLLIGNPTELDVLKVLGLFFGFPPTIAVVIIMGEVILGERKAGTIQWIISKPCSRTAFLSSKLLSNSLGVVASMVYIPGITVYFLIMFVGNIQFDFISYVTGLSIISLILIFYLTLSIMLGTISNQNSLVIGLPILFNFGIFYFLQNIREFFAFFPHGLFFPISSEYSLFSSVVMRLPIETFMPIVITLGLIIIFILISLYKFNKEEF